MYKIYTKYAKNWGDVKDVRSRKKYVEMDPCPVLD